LLWAGSSALAQEIEILVISAADGHPLPKQAVSMSFLYDKKYDKEIPANYDAILNFENRREWGGTLQTS
jgi:hypothetical protein